MSVHNVRIKITGHSTGFLGAFRRCFELVDIVVVIKERAFKKTKVASEGRF